MRLATYIAEGTERFGLVVDRGIVDLSPRLKLRSIRELLTRGALSEVARYVSEAPDRRLEDVVFLPVIPDPQHCYCVGVNYPQHLDEVRAAGIQRPRPKQPSLFVRYPESFVGDGQPLTIPKVSNDFDYEAELAVIIGKGGRYIEREHALDHVAGYSCFNDGSVREWQFHSSQVTSGKNFVATGGFGPWMVTPDEVGDVQKLAISSVVNGQVLQSSNTSEMIFSVAEIISYASALLPLQPGDVIVTGTPDGVGFSRKPPIFLKPGDICEIKIERVGTLRNTVKKVET